VTTNAIADYTEYAIDKSTFSNLFSTVATEMDASLTSISSMIYCDTANYNITIKSTIFMPVRGKIRIILP
jgi:hypothetical protein